MPSRVLGLCGGAPRWEPRRTRNLIQCPHSTEEEPRAQKGGTAGQGHRVRRAAEDAGLWLSTLIFPTHIANLKGHFLGHLSSRTYPVSGEWTGALGVSEDRG